MRETITSNGAVYQVGISYDGAGRRSAPPPLRMNPASFGSLPDACTHAWRGGRKGPDRIMRNIYDSAGQLQVRRAVGTALRRTYATYAYTLNGKQEFVIDASGLSRLDFCTTVSIA